MEKGTKDVSVSCSLSNLAVSYIQWPLASFIFPSGLPDSPVTDGNASGPFLKSGQRQSLGFIVFLDHKILQVTT